MFADASAIVPATGNIALAASRVSSAYQHVAVQTSDLRVSSRQLSVNLKPVTANTRLKWDVTYTLLDARETVRGFTSTAGNPFVTYWSALPQAGRHTFSIIWSDFPIFDVAHLTIVARATSGQRYTPLIAGDE